MFPNDGSTTRRPLLSMGSRRACSPTSAILWDAPTPCRSSRRTSLPWFGDTIVLVPFVRPPQPRTQAGDRPGVGQPGLRPASTMETAGSPKFLGTPDVPWPCSPTPVGLDMPGHCGMPTRSPRLTRARTPTRSFRGSIARPGHWLSPLRREGHPSTTPDSLPAAGQALPGGIDYPQGSNERFLSSSLVLLSQASWRNVSSLFTRVLGVTSLFSERMN